MSKKLTDLTAATTPLSGTEKVYLVQGGNSRVAAASALVAGSQPLDAKLTSWAGVTRASGFDTFSATPSSANLQALLTDESGTGPALFATSPYVGSGTRNRIINGNGAINQRGATAPTDDTYGWDRHNLLTETAAIGISTLTNVANGLPYMMRMTQSQATPQRMGNSQIFESRDCIGLRGKTVTLIGKFRNSLAAATRYAVLEWTGTADAVTSDIVNSWTNGTFTAGQFFNSTTLNVLSVGVITPTAATVTDFLLTATVGSSATNLIVFIWTETAQAQNSTLDVAWELLDYDATGKTYPTEFRPYAQELALCQRYFAVFSGSGGASEILGTGQCFSTTGAVVSIVLPVLMRVTPTMSISGAVGTFAVWSAATSALAATAIAWNAASSSNRTSAAFITVASGLVAGNNTSMIQNGSTASVYAAAEL